MSELNKNEFDYDVVIQFQKGILEKKDYNNQFNLLVRSGIVLDNKELSALLPERTVLQLRLAQEHQITWTLRCSKFYAVKTILGILMKFFEDKNLRVIKE